MEDPNIITHCPYCGEEDNIEYLRHYTNGIRPSDSGGLEKEIAINVYRCWECERGFVREI